MGHHRCHLVPAREKAEPARSPQHDADTDLRPRRSFIHSDPRWANAIAAIQPGPFLTDIASAVTNDELDDGAARWLLHLPIEFLRKHDQPHSPINAYDFAADDFEAIDRAWPAIHEMARLLDAPNHVLPSLARFVAERLPALWAREPWTVHAPVTRALVLAERTHDLVGLFMAGLKPNGSKDPYALRRAANHWLMQVICPVTIGRPSAPAVPVGASA